MKKKIMITMSPDTADTIFTYASIIAILAAILSAGAIFFTYVASTNISRYSDQKIATANSNSAQANERTQELTKQNIELQIKLEQERKERLELQTSLEPRQLSEEQINNIKNTLKKSSFSPRLEIQAQQSDNEAWEYAKNIAAALEKFGATVFLIGTGQTVMLGSSNTGVEAFIFDTQEQQSMSHKVDKLGIATNITHLQGNTPDKRMLHARIIVFKKPPYIKPKTNI